MNRAGISRGSRGASAVSLHIVHCPLKLPNISDINDLADQLRQMTDVISRLLVNGEWRKSLPPEHRELLESNVEHVKAFSKDGAKLLQTLHNTSRQVAALLASIPDSTSSSETYAREIQPNIEEIFTQISSVQQLYSDLVLGFENLIRIAPAQQPPRDVDKDYLVFQRLDALWRVVNGQLSRAFNDGSASIPPEAIRVAEARWMEYAGCFPSNVSILTECLDCLQPNAKLPKAGGNTPISGLKKVFKIFSLKRT